MTASGKTDRKLTRLERRYLSRRMCGLCEQRLDRNECLDFWEKCSADTMAKRREECLKEYRPRARQ